MQVAELPPLPVSVEFCVLSQAQDSGSRQRWWLFASLCVISFAFALGFAAMGAWLVLPYSMVEMGVLFFAFRHFERHARDWERLVVSGDMVVVESERAGRRTRQQFNRQWTRVELQASTLGRPEQVAICYAGKRVTFGSRLPVAERGAMVQQLRRVLRRGT